MKRKLVGALALLTTVIAISTIVSVAILSYSQTINTSGTVKTVNVGVYWDSQLSNPVSSIDWGLLTPGTTASVTVYVQNAGNIPLTLSLTGGNWTPSNAPDYMQLAWNQQGQIVNAGSVVAATVSLQLFSNVTTSGIRSFSLDITITGTEQ